MFNRDILIMTRRPKTLLVIPPWEGLHGFPLGPAYLASTLEKYEKPVAVLDATALGLKHDELDYWIQTAKPDIVGITSTTATYHSALDVAEIVKEVRPKAKVVMGGPHVSWTPEITLKNHPEVDYIVRWEGEYTFLDLVDTIGQKRPVKNVQGISYREKDEIKHTPDRPLIKNLDELPFPARHLFPDPELYYVEIFEEELDKQPKARKATTMVVSRGCPYQCVYCASSAFWKRTIRFRSNENVMVELRQLYKDGYRAIYFEDDQFTPDKRRTMNLCDSIIKEGMDLKWMCETRCDTVDRELLQRMYDAGCDMIFFGVEASESVRRDAGKGISNEKIIETFQNCRDIGIGTEASIQFGLPGETDEKIDETIKLLRILNPTKINLSFTAYYPGSPLSIQDRIDYNMFEKRIDMNSEIEEWKREHLAHGIGTYVTPAVSSLEKMKDIFRRIADGFPDKIWYPSEDIKRMKDIWNILMGGSYSGVTLKEIVAEVYREPTLKKLKALARSR